jgi:hypothetical protein
VVVLVASVLINNSLPEIEVLFPLIPAAVGVAILKYLPYEIDRIIRHTRS